jgi:hypothetical protein
MLQQLQRPEKVAFPPVIEIDGRLYFLRSHLEWFKAANMARSFGLEQPPFPTTRPPGDPLVSVAATAVELGVTRRTIGRKIRDQRSKPRVAAAE